MVYREIHCLSTLAYDQGNVSFAIRGTPYIDRFKIIGCCIPTAFPSTDASNNTIVFSRNGSTKTATIAPGNYNAASFPAALATAMNAVSSVKDFAVTFDDTANALTISAGSPFVIEPFSSGTTCYRQLGMGRYDVSPSGTSVSFGAPDFTNMSPLLLTSQTLISRDIIFAGNDACRLLAMIDMNTPQNTAMTWTNPGGWVFCGQEVSTLTFQLLNANTMRPVVLSQPFAITVGILTDPEDVPVA